MKKFINHVDHVVYVSRYETVEANVADLEAITDARMVRHVRQDMQCVLYIDWSAGLEMVAPLPERTPVNEALHARLDSHGEGLIATVFGVADLDAHKAKLEANGFHVGELMTSEPDEPWIGLITLRERFAPQVVNSWMVLSQIDYQDDVIRFVEVEQAAAEVG